MTTGTSTLGRIGLLSLAIALPAALALGGEGKLPEPPTGFHWERAPEIRGAFLVPHAWHFKSEKHGETNAYFVSRENIEKTGEFLVGLSVNVVPRLKDKRAVAYAQAFIAAYAEGKELLKSWDATMGPLVGSGCLVRDETTTMYALMVGNPKTNTLYYFLFEAPNAEWAAEWPTGEELLGSMLLDDEI